MWESVVVTLLSTRVVGASIKDMRIVGIDPGARETGIIVREQDTLCGATIVSFASGETLHDYLSNVLSTIRDYAPEVIVLEDLVSPTFHATQRLINAYGVIGTAIVIGAVLAIHPHTVLVPPASYGAMPLASYPDALVGVRESKGRGVLRHARSAWDISYATRLSQLAS